MKSYRLWHIFICEPCLPDTSTSLPLSQLALGILRPSTKRKYCLGSLRRSFGFPTKTLLRLVEILEYQQSSCSTLRTGRMRTMLCGKCSRRGRIPENSPLTQNAGSPQTFLLQLDVFYYHDDPRPQFLSRSRYL